MGGSRLYHSPTGMADMGLKETMRLECGQVTSCRVLCAVQRGSGPVSPKPWGGQKGRNENGVV